MPNITLGHRTMSYEAQGEGPVLLLVHGSPGSGRGWRHVAERLSNRFRVIAPDLPGYGATSPQPRGEAPDVGYACRMIEELVATMGAPAVLAGHSYGGVVALGVALRAKVPLGSLALFEPAAVQLLPLAGDILPYAAARATFEGYVADFERGNPNVARTMIEFWFGKGAFECMPAARRSFLLDHTVSHVRDVHATFRAHYSAASLRGLRVPVLTMVGARSPETTHRIAQALACHVPGGKVRTLRGADHALTSTHAAEVARAIAALAAEASIPPLAPRPAPTSTPRQVLRRTRAALRSAWREERGGVADLARRVAATR